MQDEIIMSESAKQFAENFATPTPVIEIPIATEPVVIETKVETSQQIKELTKQPITEAVADYTTDTFIYLLDFLQAFIFRFLAKRKMKNSAEEIAGQSGMFKIRLLVEKIKNNEELEKEDLLLKELNDGVNDLLEMVDLDEDEKEMLRRPMKELVKARNIQLSPEMTLLITGVMIASSRTAALYAIK